MEVITQWNPDGGIGDFDEDLGRAGWEDSLLAQKMSFEDWWAMQNAVLESSENYAVSVREPSGEILGGAILVPSMDAQVGKVLSVWHQFLRPSARGSSRVWRMVIRECESCARLAGVRFIVWTHRDEQSGRVYLKHKEI